MHVIKIIVEWHTKRKGSVLKGSTVRQGSKVKENTLMICSTVMKGSAMKKLKTVIDDEGKKIQNMDHEGHSPKHVLASSPRQGAMTSSPKLECQTTKKKSKKSSKLPKEGAR